MFAKLAKFAASYKIPIIIFWLVISAVLLVFAPAISKVGVIDDSQFLPKDTESAQARQILKEKFNSSGDESSGSAVIVVYNQNGLNDQNTQEAKALHDWLVSPDAPDVVSRIVSIFESEALRSTLISQDGTTMLIDLRLFEVSTSAVAKQSVKDIRAHIQSQNPSAGIYVTGSAGISYDLLNSVQQTIDKTTMVTIILVVCLLLLIYRSPIAIFVPLITIGVSYIVARGIVGYMASWGVTVSSLMDAYLVVLLFGIGTDYCLFMVSRFKEELHKNEPAEAGRISFRQIGPVVLASATTVIVVLLCLGISRFGMNRTAGYSLAIGVAITLVASLTLTPALISLFGKKLLWPAKLKQNKGETDGLWTRIGHRITRWPVFFVVPIIIVMVLPYLALSNINTSAEMLSQMPENMESVRGFNLLRTHFPAGDIAPTSVLVETPNSSLLQSGSLQNINNIGKSLEKIDGVASVDYFSGPPPQIMEWSNSSKSNGDAVAGGNITSLLFFKTLGQNLQNLVVQYPAAMQSTNFTAVAGNLNQLSTVSSKLQTAATQDLPGLLSQIKTLAYNIGDELKALSGEFNLQGNTPLANSIKQTYFSQDKTVTRISVILDIDPYSEEGIATVRRIRDTIRTNIQPSGLEGAAYYVGGESATQADILQVNDSDFFKVLGLAIFGVFLITAILLRSIVAPLYMVITVLFNFGATLGIATWLFLDVLKQGSIIYMLPVFVFVILVAVGADYNIFLVSRIREESHSHFLKEAIQVSVANTGGVITACGIILAGTFATLTAAPLQLVFQVGAAIAIGVLLDTFLVRALLIPSLATLAGRWSWWPSRLYRQKDAPLDSRSNKPV